MFKFSFLSLITLFLSISVILALPLSSGSSDGSHGSSDDSGPIRSHYYEYPIPPAPIVDANTPVNRRDVSDQSARLGGLSAQKQAPEHESWAVPLAGFRLKNGKEPGPSKQQQDTSKRQPDTSKRQQSTSQQPKKGFFGKIKNWVQRKL